MRDRVPAWQDRDDIVNDRANLRGHNPDLSGIRREKALSRPVEQALRRQLLARLLICGPECANARRGRGLDEQLHRTPTWEHVDVARDDDIHAVLEIESEHLGILAEQGARELGGRILQGEEHVARGRTLQVAHLAAYEDAGENRVRPDRVSDDACELRDRERLRYTRSVLAGDGDRIHSPLSAQP